MSASQAPPRRQPAYAAQTPSTRVPKDCVHILIMNPVSLGNPKTLAGFDSGLTLRRARLFGARKPDFGKHVKK